MVKGRSGGHNKLSVSGSFNAVGRRQRRGGGTKCFTLSQGGGVANSFGPPNLHWRKSAILLTLLHNNNFANLCVLLLTRLGLYQLEFFV